MATLIDGARLLYLYLTGTAALLTATSSRIYGPPLGIPAGITAPCAFLNFADDGGRGNPDIPMSAERFTFHCYGATQSEARGVFAALHDALQRAGNQRVTLAAGSVGLLRRADLEAGPGDLPDLGVNWPRVVCAFRVTFCERGFTA